MSFDSVAFAPRATANAGLLLDKIVPDPRKRLIGKATLAVGEKSAEWQQKALEAYRAILRGRGVGEDHVAAVTEWNPVFESKSPVTEFEVAKRVGLPYFTGLASRHPSKLVGNAKSLGLAALALGSMYLGSVSDDPIASLIGAAVVAASGYAALLNLVGYGYQSPNSRTRSAKNIEKANDSIRLIELLTSNTEVENSPELYSLFNRNDALLQRIITECDDMAVVERAVKLRQLIMKKNVVCLDQISPVTTPDYQRRLEILAPAILSSLSCDNLTHFLAILNWAQADFIDKMRSGLSGSELDEFNVLCGIRQVVITPASNHFNARGTANDFFDRDLQTMFDAMTPETRILLANKLADMINKAPLLSFSGNGITYYGETCAIYALGYLADRFPGQSDEVDTIIQRAVFSVGDEGRSGVRRCLAAALVALAARRNISIEGANLDGIQLSRATAIHAMNCGINILEHRDPLAEKIVFRIGDKGAHLHWDKKIEDITLTDKGLETAASSYVRNDASSQREVCAFIRKLLVDNYSKNASVKAAVDRAINEGDGNMMKAVAEQGNAQALDTLIAYFNAHSTEINGGMYWALWALRHFRTERARIEPVVAKYYREHPEKAAALTVPPEIYFT